MHHIYTTKAFVIHSLPQGESDKFILLFTKDFGMVGAVASGSRKLESKMRYHIQDGSFLEVSLVRGREVWRLTGTFEIDKVKINAVHHKILKLLRRLLHGEEKNEELFEIIEEFYKTSFSEEDFNSIECITVLRTLNTLGYIKSDDSIKKLLESRDLDKKTIEYFTPIKRNVLNIINNALKESQL